MVSVEEIIDSLRTMAKPDQLEGMARYGMSTERRLGVSVPDMRSMAKRIGKDHELALGLWETGVPEARILASMVDDPKLLTESQMEMWANGFDSWDICDQVCMNLFEKSPLAWEKIREWSKREEEYVKRAAYALLACLAWHDKKAEDERFTELFPVIKIGAADERNYVKKAVNWAIRNIGKRNVNLNEASIELARSIKLMDSKAAKWIASDALRELEGEAVRKRLKI